MRRFWGWLGLNLGKRSGTVAIVGLLVTFVFGIGVTKLSFTSTNADYLNPKDPAWLANVAYNKVFGGDPMLVMITMNPGKTVADLFTPANQKLMQKVGTELENDPWVFSDVTPLDAMSLSNVLLSIPAGGTILDSPAARILEDAVKRDPSKASQAARFKYLETEGNVQTSFPSDQQKLSNPKWVNFLLHEPDGSIRTAVQAFVPNDTHALLVVDLKGNLTINQEGVAARSVSNILDPVQFQNAHVLATGVPALLKTINDYLKHGVVTLALVAAVLMIAILALSFTVRWRFLAFAIVAVGCVWGFGLVGFFHIPLTLATIAAIPVLLGVGMDYAIQMHSRIEEEVLLDRSQHPVQAAARGLGPALLVVTFDAVFSFMALWFAKTPAIREFGSLLVVGIVAVCVCSIITTLAVLGIREYKSPTKGKDFSKGRLSRVVVLLSRVPRKFALPLALSSVLIFLGGIAVEGHLHIQTDAISWINPHAKAIEDIKAVKAGTGSANEIAINLTTDQPFSDQTVSYVTQLSRWFQHKYHGVLLPAAGLVSTVDQFMNTVPHTTHIPPTGAEIEGLYLLSTPGIRHTTIANDGHSINIIFRAVPDTLSSLAPVVKDIEGGVQSPQSRISPPPGIAIAPGGIAVVGVGLIENLEKSRVLLTYLAVLFVGAFLAVRLRSVVRSLLSLAPVLVAVGSVALIAFALNLKLSPVTAVTGPLVVAVCTEFTSLILLRFVEERERGYAPREAMDATARRTGRAFMVSGMVAIAGVGTLASSSFPLLRDFGIIVAMNVTVALLAALVVLPPILVAAEQRGWVTRGLLRKQEVPFIEFEPGQEPAWAQAPVPDVAPGREPVGVSAVATAAPAPPPPPPPGGPGPVTVADGAPVPAWSTAAAPAPPAPPTAPPPPPPSVEWQPQVYASPVDGYAPPQVSVEEAGNTWYPPPVEPLAVAPAAVEPPALLPTVEGLVRPPTVNGPTTGTGAIAEPAPPATAPAAPPPPPPMPDPGHTPGAGPPVEHDVAVDLVDAPAPQPPRPRGARIASIAARLVGMDDR